MNKIFSYALCIGFIILLTGCGGLSKSQLLKDEKVEKSFYTTNTNYQQEYINIHNKLEECYAWESAGVGQKIDGQIFTELNKAEISLKFDSHYRVFVEIFKVQSNKTKVNIYNGFSNVKNMKDILLNKSTCRE